MEEKKTSLFALKKEEKKVNFLDKCGRELKLMEGPEAILRR